MPTVFSNETPEEFRELFCSGMSMKAAHAVREQSQHTLGQSKLDRPPWRRPPRPARRGSP